MGLWLQLLLGFGSGLRLSEELGLWVELAVGGCGHGYQFVVRVGSCCSLWGQHWLMVEVGGGGGDEVGAELGLSVSGLMGRANGCGQACCC
jgi:hypothetical protein